MFFGAMVSVVCPACVLLLRLPRLELDFGVKMAVEKAHVSIMRTDFDVPVLQLARLTGAELMHITKVRTVTGFDQSYGSGQDLIACYTISI
jgi:hypothetical protein